jgi:hypothetical protein
MILKYVVVVLTTNELGHANKFAIARVGGTCINRIFTNYNKAIKFCDLLNYNQ